MRVVAIIQARMGSTRLPGKVIADLGGEPMLSRVVSRTSQAVTVERVVVATTTLLADDLIVDLCLARGWDYFRGSENDVLDRYYQAAKSYGADVVVRVTSDCPLIEPEIIDRVVRSYLTRQPHVDYASNIVPQRTFPRGLDIEAVRFAALERAWREDLDPAWREHVTPYINRHPELFIIHNEISGSDFSHLRWTVDTPEDLALVRRIFHHFGHGNFTWREVLDLLQQQPDWLELNKTVEQKAI